MLSAASTACAAVVRLSTRSAPATASVGVPVRSTPGAHARRPGPQPRTAHPAAARPDAIVPPASPSPRTATSSVTRGVTPRRADGGRSRRRSAHPPRTSPGARARAPLAAPRATTSSTRSAFTTTAPSASRTITSPAIDLRHRRRRPVCPADADVLLRRSLRPDVARPDREPELAQLVEVAHGPVHQHRGDALAERLGREQVADQGDRGRLRHRQHEHVARALRARRPRAPSGCRRCRRAPSAPDRRPASPGTTCTSGRSTSPVFPCASCTVATPSRASSSSGVTARRPPAGPRAEMPRRTGCRSGRRSAARDSPDAPRARCSTGAGTPARPSPPWRRASAPRPA